MKHYYANLYTHRKMPYIPISGHIISVNKTRGAKLAATALPTRRVLGAKIRHHGRSTNIPKICFLFFFSECCHAQFLVLIKKKKEILIFAAIVSMLLCIEVTPLKRTAKIVGKKMQLIV